jgi:hypothetical protein
MSQKLEIWQLVETSQQGAGVECVQLPVLQGDQKVFAHISREEDNKYNAPILVLIGAL